MNEKIYCITTADHWHTAKASGQYQEHSLETEGFIHCCYPHQMEWVANKHFKGMSDLLVLEVLRSKVRCQVVDEDLSNLNDLFPHIYGVMNVDAVSNVIPFPSNKNGLFELPEILKGLN